MNKKILISLIVIVSGLMLGFTFSNQIPARKDSPSSTTSPNLIPSTRPALPTKAMVIKTSVKLDKPSIDAFEGDHTKEFDKVDKAMVLVTYQNTTNEDLTDLKLWIDADNLSGIKFSSTENAKQNNPDISRTGKRVFDVPDIEAGQTKNVYVVVFGETPGKYNLTAQLKSTEEEDLSITTDPVTLTVR